MDLLDLSAAELAQKCLTSFDRCLAYRAQGEYVGNDQQPSEGQAADPSLDERLEYKLADFNLWIDGIGALAPSRASLDWRLNQRPIDLELVKGNLVMLYQSLQDYADLQRKHKSIDEALLDVKSALGSLASLALAVRRTGRRSRLHKADRLFDEEEHSELKQHLECIVVLRPGEGGYSSYSFKQKLEELTPVQQRLVVANLRRRNRFLQAQRHSTGLKKRELLSISEDAVNETHQPIASPDLEIPNPAYPGYPAVEHLPKLPENTHAPTISGTSASVPESELRYNDPILKKPEASAPRTEVTRITATAHYPQPRLPDDNQQMFQCPCCYQTLPVQDVKTNTRWRKHLSEDICPYTCLVEDCPTPDIYYSTRTALEQHIRQDHSPTWQCPLCEDEPQFTTMTDMMEHFMVFHQDAAEGNDISTLISLSTQKRTGIDACPLCDVAGIVDSPELIDHVLEHVHDFSLRSLPWPRPSHVNLGGEVGTFDVGYHKCPSVIQWLGSLPEGDGDMRLQLSQFDHNQVITVGSQISPLQDDDLPAEICFADEHGDESAAAETDISFLSQETPSTSSMTSGSDEEDNIDMQSPECRAAVELFSRLKGESMTLSEEAFEMFVGRQQPSGHKTLPNREYSRFTSFYRVWMTLGTSAEGPLPPKDLSRPLTNYFINSSHNTHLVGNQLGSRSSPEPYRDALMQGCRFVEIDVWDGYAAGPSIQDFSVGHRPNASMSKFGTSPTTPTQPASFEPIVTRGWTLTTSCGFREVCATIGASAFVNNDLPVIVSLEVHADVGQQEVMVRIMKEEWGELLLDKPLEGYDPKLQCPRLCDLRRKILVKVRWGKVSATADDTWVDLLPDMNAPMSDSESSICDPGNLAEVAPKAKASMVVICQALERLVIYTQSEKFSSLDTAVAKKQVHILSLSEDRLLEVNTTNETGVFSHNKNYFMHCFPSGRRTDTSNPDPTLFWRLGVQMVSMNWQNLDEGMMLHRSMFAAEDGWVLKPSGYRSMDERTNTWRDVASRHDGSWGGMHMLLTIYSGFDIPDNAEEDEDSTDLCPQVKVELHVGQDKDGEGRSYKYQTMIGKTKQPHFGSAGSMARFHGVKDFVSELSFLRFKVVDTANSSGYQPLLGWACIRLDRLQQGYRIVELLDAKGRRTSGVLLVKISIHGLKLDR